MTSSASASKGLRALVGSARYSLCVQCRRSFTTSPLLSSGHSKWSTIKHKKGAADKKSANARQQHVSILTVLSRLYGADPRLNGQLADAIVRAKKAQTPKSVIDQAIARGQGRSLSGETLESMKYEIMMPPSVALIVEVETDSKKRILQDLHMVMKAHKGRQSNTEFFFSRLGRVVFQKKDGVGVDEIMDDVIEAGAEDLEADEEGNIIVMSPPNQVTSIAQNLSKKLNLNVLESEITWSANEDTKAQMDSVEDVQNLSKLVAALQEVPDVQAVYANAKKGDSIPDEEWEALDGNLDG